MGAGNHTFPIEYVIVLMLENRSCDHMLGYLPNGYGLTGDEFNLVDPSGPTSEQVRVTNKSGYTTAVDPAHDFVSVETELFGEPAHIVDPASMGDIPQSIVLEHHGRAPYHSKRFVKLHADLEKGDIYLLLHRASLSQLSRLEGGRRTPTARREAGRTPHCPGLRRPA